MALDSHSLETCDSLYLSPHPDDVPRSCGARLVSEAAKGQTILVVTVFGGNPPPLPLAGDGGGGLRQIALEIPPAPQRNPYYSSFAALTEGRHGDDEAWLGQAAELLNDVRHRTKARQVYVPLGVGSHIDHRLCHEAALRVFSSGDGRNVFLYEERPESIVQGAVRARLGELGARLPPAAAQAADGTALAPFLMRFHVAAQARGDMKGWPERLRAARVATRQWRHGREWHPQKGFGPRLQPVVQTLQGDAVAALTSLREACPSLLSGRGASERLAALSTRYSRRLGGDHAERYWLLLPTRDPALATLAAGAHHAARGD
jgi:LmbE family N-acetylglucosaminyl deacetylase